MSIASVGRVVEIQPATDITHLAEDPNNTTATNFTHALVNTTINGHLCFICYLAFVSFIVFGCHYPHALNLNHLRGRHAYHLHYKWWPRCDEQPEQWRAAVSQMQQVVTQNVSTASAMEGSCESAATSWPQLLHFMQNKRFSQFVI